MVSSYKRCSSKSRPNVMYPTCVLAKKAAWQDIRGKITFSRRSPQRSNRSPVRWTGSRVEVKNGQRATGHPCQRQEGRRPGRTAGYCSCPYQKAEWAKCSKHFFPNSQILETNACTFLFGTSVIYCRQICRKVSCSW